jgi:putative hemolysin
MGRWQSIPLPYANTLTILGTMVHNASTTQSFQLDTTGWIQLIVLIFALILCSLASAAETALTSVSRIKLKDLMDEGDRKARQIEKILVEPNAFLSTILVINRVAVVVATCMATLLTLRFTHVWAALVASAAASIIIIIFCEISPKTTAIQNPLGWARALLGLIRFTTGLLRPIVWLLNLLPSFFLRITGGTVRHRGAFVTEDELRLLFAVGEDEGVLEQEETEMIHSIFQFAETTAREVMVPRIDMVTLPDIVSVMAAVDLALQGGFSRIPVYSDESGIDEVIGILYTKDLLRQMREGKGEVPIREFVREPYFIPETKKLDDLLAEFRQNHNHMAIVVDEYGSVAGLVTIEDLMEEIVGDIQDEYDHEETLYEYVDEHTYIVDAKMSIYDFNELLGANLEDVDYETLGGFVYSQLDKIPSIGDTITHENLTFMVLATRGRRILKVRVERHQAGEPQETPRISAPEPVLQIPETTSATQPDPTPETENHVHNL